MSLVSCLASLEDKSVPKNLSLAYLVFGIGSVFPFELDRKEKNSNNLILASSKEDFSLSFIEVFDLRPGVVLPGVPGVAPSLSLGDSLSINEEFKFEFKLVEAGKVLALV